MICNQCKQDQAQIQQATDNYYKVVYCTACNFQEHLRNYNNKTNKTNNK